MQNSDDENNGNLTGQTTNHNNTGLTGNANDGNSKLGAPQLSTIELRVLGVLMEKQLTTPDQYPLTLNSVITACNQKSSRDPISHYNQGEVHRALQTLDDKHFIRRERGSRSEKFSQQFMDHLQLGRKQQALLCVMMLRGPQTVSELNTRTQRMCEFSDKDELEHSIDRLCNRDVPYATRLGQQPGQRGDRVGHLFSGKPTVLDSSPTQTNAPVARREQGQSLSTHTDGSDDPKLEALTLEVATLTETVNNLKEESAQLKQQLAALYALTGHTN